VIELRTASVEETRDLGAALGCVRAAAGEGGAGR
jgi:hypothetical protein